jgi:hypothetical protein
MLGGRNMTIKEIFDKATSENKSLTYAEFEALAKQSNAKYVDLAEGNYVGKQKYEDDLATKDVQINSLNETISTRDTDLANLQKQLEDAGADSTKLAELTTQFTDLQAKYAEDTGNLQTKLAEQEYDFAVRDFANGQKFSCEAAKIMFEQDMIAKKLPMENKKIMGANDYLAEYKKVHKDSFAVEKPAEPPKPTFAAPTGDGNGTGNKMSLSDMMKLANENPNAVINFD